MTAIVSLIGARCSGKTTTGRSLAGRLGWRFVDLDDELGAPAGELLTGRGEPAFRRIEARALGRVLERSAGAQEPLVLATGGGAVLDPASRRALRERTRCAWLRCDAAVLRSRMDQDATARPSLTGAPASEEISGVLAVRAPLYAATAEFTLDVDTLGPDEVAARLADWLR